MSKVTNIVLSSILTLVSLLLVCGVIELSMRIMLFSENAPSFGLKHAWRFADGNMDDDFWKLMYVFDELESATRVGFADPELGWDSPRSDQDPIGIHAQAPYSIDDFENPLLFYGDSFVAGTNNIPRKLDNLLEARDVINFGVGGYGVDQIYLKFSKTADLIASNEALVGILTYDLDRSVLSIRSHPKPYFEVIDGKLILKNVPVPASMEDYLDSNPIRIKSYLYRFVLFRLRNLLSEATFNRLLGYDRVEALKQSVNFAIVQALTDAAVDAGLNMRVVIFYAGEEINAPTWRGEFLKSTLQRLNIAYFDTRKFLLDHMHQTDVTVETLYEDNLGHLNQYGQQVIATGIAEWLTGD